MNTNAALNLYLRKNKENFNAGNFCENLFYPLSAYLIAYIIKRKISIKDFLNEQLYQLHIKLSSFENNKISLQQVNIYMYNIELKISKKKNKERIKILYLTNICSLFILFSLILESSFCGIYENSLDCLVVNTLISIFFSFVITNVLLLISSIIRVYSLRKENRCMFIISCFLNPYYISFLSCKKNKNKIVKNEEIKSKNNENKEEKDKEDEDKEEDKKKEDKEENKKEDEVKKEGKIEANEG